MSIIRRRRHYLSCTSDNLNSITTLQCRVYALYLYEMCIADFESNDMDAVSASISFFMKLLERLGIKDKVEEFLSNTIKKAEENGTLTRMRDNMNNDICFDYSDVRYVYEEDKAIDRKIPSMREVDLFVINLFRCMHFTRTNFLAALIANFLIRKEAILGLPMLNNIPSTVKKALEDNSIVNFVSQAVKLEDDEIRLLSFYSRLYTCKGLKAVYDEFTKDKQHDIARKILDISSKKYSSLIRSDNKLRSFGFLDANGFIEYDFIECVEAQSMKPFFSDLLKEETQESYPLSSFNINENTSTIMTRMLLGTEPVSLMLYGKPGSGKTEYAKTLAKNSGYKTYIFRNERELVKGGDSTNVLCRLNCLLSFKQKDSVFIIDEADTLLQTKATSFWGLYSPSSSKGIVNKMLEENCNKVIWIVNFTNQIDESTLRRFTYSYKFEAMTYSQLRAIAQKKLSPLALDESVNTRILDLLERYSVTGSSVDNIVKTIKTLDTVDSEKLSNEDLVDCIQSVLKENSLLINGKSKVRENVSESYEQKALNASIDPSQIVRMVRNAQEFARQNSSSRNAANSGIRMLFYGVSGTGKTEFARYIAESLGKKLLLQRASDILDKYVGGSEQNIKDAFETAARTESILLFDEADSFFADRRDAEHSWERTQVNEFLTQMEEFPGIVICTTNLKNIMDSAMNRRFHLIVEFKPLTSEGIKCMLESYFSSYSFSEAQIERLERFGSITLGDFGALAGRIRFIDADELSSNYIVEELIKMQDEKDSSYGNHKIGFAIQKN